MKDHASVVALAIITLALVSCSKKPAGIAITQQKASGYQVVTNDDGTVVEFRNVIKRTTNSAPATDVGPVSVVTTVIKHTNSDGTVSVFTRRAMIPAPATNGLSR